MSEPPLTIHPPEKDTSRSQFLINVFFALGIMLLTTSGWLIATGIRTPSEWGLPSAYLGAQKSDVIGMLAVFRAAADGHYTPTLQKMNPRLGAPGEANWSAIPVIEEIPYYLTGLLARHVGIFSALNLKLLVGHILVSLAFFFTARYFRCQIEWASAGAIIFGLSPFIFEQSPHHSIVAYVWHLPLFVLVWDWCSRDVGISIHSRRFLAALCIAAITSLQNIYYTNVFCQLVLLGSLVTAIRGRAWGPLVSGLGIISVSAMGVGVMMIDSIVNTAAGGPGIGGITREYRWLEIYGLKIVDLFIPPVTHMSGIFSTFAARHASESILQDEGSYLGLAGIAALFLLAGTAARNVVQRKCNAIPLEAWQVMWIVVMFTTGGLNSILGSFGFTMFRATHRYSVVILVIVLMYAARQLSQLNLPKRRFVVYAATGLTIIAFWDQIPRPPGLEEKGIIAAQVEADRNFVAAMQDALPAGAMIFQTPIMDFPESPAPGIPPYDHLRPYLYSRTLRFSFGGVKGRSDTAWQRELTKTDLPTVLKTLREKGFSAIYINRNGFPDKAEGFLKALAGLGVTQRIDSPMGDLVCVIIPSTAGG